MIKIKYDSNSYSFDKKMRCNITNLSPGDVLDVKTRVLDEHNKLWESEFKAKTDSTSYEFNLDDIMLNTTYKKVYGKTVFNNLPIRVFEYLNKKKISAKHYIPKFIKLSDKPMILDITILINNKVLEQRSLEYRTYNSSIKKLDITDEFIGKYYYRDDKKHPTIIVLGGSMGDFNWCEQYAAVLSNMGYNTLAVSYFSFRGLNKLPRNLLNIDMKYFNSVLNWVKKNNKNLPIGVMGLSKGAELALLLGTEFKKAINAIIALSPSSHIFEGVYLGENRGVSSWSSNDKELSFIKYPKKSKFSLFMEPGYLYDVHHNGLAISTLKELEEARIKVEKIECPTLLVTGEEDLTWPSKNMAETIIKKNDNINWINYPKVGHIFNIPHTYPILESNEHYYKYAYWANNDTWEKVCNFFKSNLIIE